MKQQIRFALLLLILCILATGCQIPALLGSGQETVPTTTVTVPTEAPTTVVTEPPIVWENGFVASLDLTVEYFDEAGNPAGTLTRGAAVEYATMPDGRVGMQIDGAVYYLQDGATIVADAAQVIPAHTLYVRTAVNLRDSDSRLLPAFAEKGQAVDVTGYDYLLSDGSAHMYRVSLVGADGKDGYIMPWYLADNEANALANYDNGHYATHEGRGNRYGGGKRPHRGK